MRWAVWYGDGSRLASDEWRVQDLPGCNVQVIAQEWPEVGRRLLKGRDRADARMPGRRMCYIVINPSERKALRCR